MPFVPLLHCACRVACEYGSISRFKGVLRGFWGVGVIFVWVWGFAWLVWLLCACGVWRFRGLWRACLYFVLFYPPLSSFLSSILSSILSFCSCVCLSFCPLCSCFYLFSCFPCLSSCPLLVLLPALFVLVSLWGLCFLFPFRTMRKKKGRNSLRPLLSCCVLLYLVAALYSSYSSGVSPFIS